MDRLLVAAKESTHAPRRNLPYEHSHVVARGGNVFPAAQHGQSLGECPGQLRVAKTALTKGSTSQYGLGNGAPT